MSQEVKLIFTGTTGAGKTTAIGTISEIPMVSTDVFSTDELRNKKSHTTVAMDYGELTLENGELLRLYGTPGQECYSFMWKILVNGGLGLVILVDNARTDPLYDLSIYLDNFAEFITETGVVIGVTRMDIQDTPSIDDYYQFLAEKYEVYPLFPADVRKSEDVLMLLEALLSILEY